MKGCKKCSVIKDLSEYYANDNTCKDCRKEMVRKNRQEKSEYYREYDKKRFKEDPRVKARHAAYQASEAGKEAKKKANEKWVNTNPSKRAAHVILGNALKNGKITKPTACETCGKDSLQIHGHHDDYYYPLQVRWLCPACHRAWHKQHGEALNGSID